MPYRRLPNTDEARIRALQKIVDKEGDAYLYGHIVSFETMREAKVLLDRFKEAQRYYKIFLKTQTSSNQKYQKLIKNARLYISHFIQVLNLSIIRAEIKEEHKELYGLNPSDYSIPDMLSDGAILSWGEKIMQGENDRIQHGGAPIYNPTIAKVRVHYDLFKDACHTQKIHQKNTARALEAVAEQRDAVDKVIAEVWNQVEDHFKDIEGEARLDKCREYGVVYYYRKGETRP